MKRVRINQLGFTIVELLIVIVVIAILAAITVVAYTGIQRSATASAVQSSLSQAAKKAMTYALKNGNQYPDTLAEVGITDSDSVTYQYSNDTSITPGRFAITATGNYDISYYVSSSNNAPKEGIAPGHNLVVWDETRPETVAVPQATIDTAQYYSAPASMRIGINSSGRNLRNMPLTADPGKVITVTMWLKTDANWNGTNGNSKIRFGGTGGTLLKDCGYEGVKTSWTFVTCNYTFTSAHPNVSVSVGNSGTIGNIWIDDLKVSIE